MRIYRKRMDMSNDLVAKATFRIREQFGVLIGSIHSTCYKKRGARIGKTSLRHSFHMTWPHRIGDGSRMERDVTLKVDAIYTPELANNIGDNVEFNVEESVVVSCPMQSTAKLCPDDGKAEEIWRSGQPFNLRRRALRDPR